MAYLLDDIKALRAQVEVLGERYQALLPDNIVAAVRLLDLQGGPNAWASAELLHPETPGLDGMATLAVVAQQLDGLICREQSRGTTPNLKLTKKREGT